MIRHIVFLLIILIGYQSINGQEKYWVFLKDKKFSAVDTHDYLDQKAKNRRKKIGFPLNHYSDIPVCISYVDEVTSKANHILGVSRWFNAICVAAFEEQISEIKLLPYVVEVQPLKPVLHACHVDVKNKTINNLAERQISSLEGQVFQNKGLDGKGLRICVIDGGFKGALETPSLQHLFKKNQIVKTWDFHYKREDVYKYSEHGTAVLSCIAGKYQNQILGLAQSAEFLLARTERVAVENETEEVLWLMAMEWADANGADIINTSLGYASEEYFNYQMDGKTSIIARAANMAAKKGILVLVSAGNSGDSDWKYIATPADADSVLTIGAITSSGIHRSFSSFGPTADFRMKPNVVAYGDVMGASKKGISKTQGTSFSCPLVAGYAACVWQNYPDKTNMEIFELIEKSGSLYPYFDYAHGYGVPKASYYFKDEIIIPTFEIIRNGNTIKIELTENQEVHHGTQYMFMHVENDKFNYEGQTKKVLEKYKTILVHSKNPITINANDYKDKILRFHFNGYMNEIRL